MAKRPRRRLPTAKARGAHEDHLQARRDHREWTEDLARWRTEYHEALAAFAQRMIPQLELENFEEAMDRHEAAIAVHEDLVDRHERVLARGATGAQPLEEYDSLHEQVRSRHELSRAEHAQIRRTHRAVLEALEMVGRKARR